MIFVRLFGGFLIQTIPFALLCLYPFKNTLRFSVKKTTYMTSAVILLLDLVFSVTAVYFNEILADNKDAKFASVNITFMLCLVPCFIWVLYASKAIWQKKLFVYSFTLTSALALTSISNVIQEFVDLSEGIGLPYGGLSPYIMLVVNGCTLPFLILLLKRGYIPASPSLTKKEDKNLAVLSLVLFFIMAGGLAFFDYDNLRNPLLFIIWIAQILLIFIIYLFIFKTFSLSRERLSAQQISLSLNQQLKILNEQHLRFNDSIESSRRMRHDLKHHMLTVLGFLSEGKIDNAEEYLKQYIKVSEDYEMPKICDVPVINWILNYYQMVSKEKGIDFTMRVSTPPFNEIEIKDSDLSVLLGNLLENAVAGAGTGQEGEPRFIKLNIIHSGKMLVITVDNSFNGIVNICEGKYDSTKENHSGLGIKSIEGIAEKYSGGTEFTNSDTVLHSSVMLNIR